MSEDRNGGTRPTAARELAEGYYADNFEAVLETVEARYRDLLDAGELAFFDDWRGLSLAARRLYVRLISRKGPFFRRDRIAYAEIPELDAALAELTAAAFLDDAPGTPAAELAALALKAELVEMSRRLLPAEACPPPTARKVDVAAALVRQVDAETLERALRKLLEVLRPLRQEQVLVFRLLFFGNLRQDWTEFVLRDLGVVRFEDYEVRTELRLFPTREALDDTLDLSRRRQEVQTLLVEGELDQALDLGRTVLERRDGWHPAARHPFDRICNELGRTLERAAVAGAADFETALGFYEAAASPPARERRARILARLGRLEEALRLCREIEEAPRDETEVAFGPRFALALRKLRGERVPRTQRPRRPTVELEVEKRDGLPVERLALEALAARGREGFFSENWLWKSLFGLAFWDVIFAPVEGAFQHPFQYGPLDLGTPDFRKARREAVAERLAELRRHPRPGPLLLPVYDEKVDTANRLVAWGEELRRGLETALERLTGEHLARVCDRLSRDVRRYRRGFPDLFVLRDTEPGFELLEVKAPGDQLRPEQGAWIDYLNASGLPASVLKLVWSR